VSFLNGYKTYLSALGLLGLGVFQLTQGNIPGGIQSLLAAATAASMRHAIAQSAPARVPPPPPGRGLM